MMMTTRRRIEARVGVTLCGSFLEAIDALRSNI